MIELLPYPLLLFAIIVVPFRATCYYFHGFGWNVLRILKGEKVVQYEACKDCPYGGSVDSYHRYFAKLAMFITLFIHFPITIYHIIVPESQWAAFFSLANIPGWVFTFIAAIASMFNPANIHPHFGLFNVTEVLDSLFLFLYVYSCHAIRFSMGSGKRDIGKSQQKMLKFQTKLNNHHGRLFWASLVTVTVHSALIIMKGTA
ncbi:MAG: hypothetical protein HZB68_02650 [Candidatus Aenigmarchaeota archaeon]|nr:hypothetical protein [Candidatus Aenigmarchaeota archaeon]